MDNIFEIAWLVLLLLFALGEAVTVGLTSIWFAAGSLAALICALLGGAVWLQIVLFLAVSILCLLAVRPLAKKYVNAKAQPTNIQGKGAVTIGGVVWTARSEDGQPISAGSLVRILRIEGVKVFVEMSKEEAVCH